MARVDFPDYRRDNLTRAYPFDDTVTRTNGVVSISDDVFVDGKLYPVGADENLHISSIDVRVEDVEITISDGSGPVGTGTFDADNPPGLISFSDSYSRPIGVLVAFSDNLKQISGWNVGLYIFLESQTRFASTVCSPQPQTGVRGIVIPDGSYFSGDVYIVGEGGVQLTNFQAPPGRSDLDSLNVGTNEIRVDLVGDPLYKRKLCNDLGSQYEHVRVVKTINFVSGDEKGDFKITVGDASVASPALRVIPTDNGIKIGFVKEI